MTVYKEHLYANKIILLLVDILLLLAVFKFVFHYQTGSWQLGGDYPMLFAIFVLLWWILAGHFANPNSGDRLTTYTEKFWALIWIFILHTLVLTTGILVLHVRPLPLRYLVLLYGAAAVTIISGRLLLSFLHRTYRYRWARPRNRFVVIGTSRSGCDLYRFLTVHNPETNQFLGFFTDEPAPSEVQHLVRGRLSEVQEFCLREQVNELYFALPLNQTDLIQDLSNFADDQFIAFRIVPDFEGTMRKTVNVHYHDYGPILTVRRHPLGFRSNQIAKRLFDLAFSSFVIVGIFPVVLPLLALLIRLDSPGPIFFKQMRPGKRNEPFPCYKLRTMRANLSGTELQATKGDMRVTRVGRFLRASSLDELPQFFNVWLGHMSVVGPRPNMTSQLEQYSKQINTYAQRHVVTPGITGYAQVNGFRGETRAVGAMEKRVEYDMMYVENWSLLLDVKIIGRTVWNMVSGEKNAY